MPLFDFVCQNCQHDYEDLIRADEHSACPQCESTRVERQLPVFAVQGGRSSDPVPGPGGCGTCGDPRGPGSCSM
jgi:putative FmdB family regulatory protein